MRVLRRVAAVLLCTFGMAYPGRAGAQSAAPIELKWSALEGCPSADSVLARVHEIAGTTRATPNTLRADAAITQPKDGLFRLRLEIRYGDLAAVRNIEGKSCKDLAGAAAVALALLLSSEEPLSQRDLAGTLPATTDSSSDLSGDNQGPDQQAAPAKPAPTSPPVQPTPAAPDANAEGRPPRRWRALLVAPLAALSLGPMKEVSRGLGLGAGISFDRWRVLAEAKWWASQRETISNVAEYAVEFERFTVGARGCRSILGSRFEFAPCVLMSVHHLSVSGSGPALVSRTDSATWAAVGVGVQARFLLASWFGIIASVDGELQFARPEVSVSLPGPPPPGSHFPAQVAVPVERLAPAAATLTAGFQWIL